MRTTSLFVYSLSGTLFEGEVSGVTVPGEDGELTVLPTHAPIVTALKNGKILAHTSDSDGGREFFIESGFVYADQKSVVCLVTETKP